MAPLQKMSMPLTRNLKLRPDFILVGDQFDLAQADAAGFHLIAAAHLEIIEMLFA